MNQPLKQLRYYGSIATRDELFAWATPIIQRQAARVAAKMARQAAQPNGPVTPRDVDVEDLRSAGYVALLEAHAKHGDDRTRVYHDVHRAIDRAAVAPGEASAAYDRENLAKITYLSHGQIPAWELRYEVYRRLCAHHRLLPAEEPQHETPETRNAREERRAVVRAALGTLLPLEQSVLAMRFSREKTLVQLGHHYGYTAAAVRNWEYRALHKLRTYVRKRHPDLGRDDID